MKEQSEFGPRGRPWLVVTILYEANVVFFKFTWIVGPGRRAEPQPSLEQDVIQRDCRRCVMKERSGAGLPAKADGVLRGELGRQRLQWRPQPIASQDHVGDFWLDERFDQL